jgi:hypothetical protein
MGCGTSQPQVENDISSMAIPSVSPKATPTTLAVPVPQVQPAVLPMPSSAAAESNLGTRSLGTQEPFQAAGSLPSIAVAAQPRPAASPALASPASPLNNFLFSTSSSTTATALSAVGNAEAPATAGRRKSVRRSSSDGSSSSPVRDPSQQPGLILPQLPSGQDQGQGQVQRGSVRGTAPSGMGTGARQLRPSRSIRPRPSDMPSNMDAAATAALTPEAQVQALWRRSISADAALESSLSATAAASVIPGFAVSASVPAASSKTASATSAAAAASDVATIRKAVAEEAVAAATAAVPAAVATALQGPVVALVRDAVAVELAAQVGKG